jgi:hypothetical protein
VTVPFSELQSIAPSAIIELFQLQLNVTQHGVSDIYRFHAGTNAKANHGNIVWASQSYQALPIEAEGFEYSGNGQLPRPKIRVSNIMGTITALLLSLPNGLGGAKVTRIRTLARYLDAVNFPDGANPFGTPDPTASLPDEIYFIDRKSAETRDVVEFEMCAAFDLIGVRGPKRQCIANVCQWKYRSTECSYNKPAYYDANNNPVASSDLDVCGKRLDSCEARFSVYTRTGTVSVGSNVWTTASTLSILPGEPIRGWGLPTGTTVSTVASSTTLTLSNNSTASSSETKTGTASATAAFLTVNNTTGLGVGMTVSGNYMNGATVTGISGLTILLSARPYSIFKTGTYQRALGNDYIVFPDGTSGILVGMNIFGSFSTGTTTVVAVEPTRVQIDTGGIKTDIFGIITKSGIFYQAIPGLNYPVNGAAVSAYFIPASPASSSYTFSANTTYAFRDPENQLPFGSFPGTGAFTQ